MRNCIPFCKCSVCSICLFWFGDSMCQTVCSGKKVWFGGCMGQRIEKANNHELCAAKVRSMCSTGRQHFSNCQGQTSAVVGFVWQERRGADNAKDLFKFNTAYVVATEALAILPSHTQNLAVHAHALKIWLGRVNLCWCWKCKSASMFSLRLCTVRSCWNTHIYCLIF